MRARPNILFVLADQLGARWLPTYGHPIVSTPYLDAFAGESTIFERAITTAPICTPYRGCLLSGLYPSQTGIVENGKAYPANLPSLADYLNTCGYATSYIGKWHLSGAPHQNRRVPPAARAGFQHFIGWESHHVDHWGGLIWSDESEQPSEMPGHETDSLTDIAIQELGQLARQDTPFFMLVSFQAPHPPCSPPRDFHELYSGRDLLGEPNTGVSARYDMPHWNANYDAATFRQLYFGEISHLDAAFGRLLRGLADLNLQDNTLVLFTSDHGEMAGAHGKFGKGVMYEEALHVPLVVRAPGQTQEQRTRICAATIDLLPTLLDYAGCDCARSQWGEGISLRGCIDHGEELSERIVFSEYHDFCATTCEWKLVTRGRSLQPAALYNLCADPFEMNNRLTDHAAAGILDQLGGALSDWREAVTETQRATESERAWQTAII